MPERILRCPLVRGGRAKRSFSTLRPTKELIMATDLRERLLSLPTATIYETQGQLGDMDPIIKPVVPGIRLAGRAFTVKCPIGDYTAVVRAIDTAQPGDVLVIDGGGSIRGTIMGGTTTRAAKKRGLAGFVT